MELCGFDMRVLLIMVVSKNSCQERSSETVHEQLQDTYLWKKYMRLHIELGNSYKLP